MTRYGVPMPHETRCHHFEEPARCSPSLAAGAPLSTLLKQDKHTQQLAHGRSWMRTTIPRGLHNCGHTSPCNHAQHPHPRWGSRPQEPNPFSPSISQTSLSYSARGEQVARVKEAVSSSGQNQADSFCLDSRAANTPCGAPASTEHSLLGTRPPVDSCEHRHTKPQWFLLSEKQ